MTMTILLRSSLTVLLLAVTAVWSGCSAEDTTQMKKTDRESALRTAKAEDTSMKTIGEIVAADYRTSKVFAKYGIDFCCGGKVPLSVACREKGINPASIGREIEAVRSEPIGRSQDYASWGLSFLSDYILNTHHAYLKENTGQIAAYAHKIAEVHGARHPEVIRIAVIYDTIATDMASHLRQEEEVLFPAIKRIDATRKAGKTPETKDLNAIKTCLASLQQDHTKIGEALQAIRNLAKGYAMPDDVCNTYVITYNMLKEFEGDLHKHVHMENNILFPKAAWVSEVSG